MNSQYSPGSIGCPSTLVPNWRNDPSETAPLELSRPSTPAREPTNSQRDRAVESLSLQQRVHCEPDADDFLAAGRGGDELRGWHAWNRDPVFGVIGIQF